MNITLPRAVIEQALKALERPTYDDFLEWASALKNARDALRTALEQPEQEPAAWRFKPMVGSPWSLSDDGYYISCKRDKGYLVEPLYTAPPQRKPLSDDEIQAFWEKAFDSGSSPRDFARAIEVAHNIKEDA